MKTVKKKKAFPTIALLIAIFFIPMLLAWLTYSKGFLLSKNTVNHGILLQPPLSITQLALVDNRQQPSSNPLPGKWVLTYISSQSETKPTHQTSTIPGEYSPTINERTLYYLRQIRQATGKNRDRVERAIITTTPNPAFDNWLAAHYPGTQHFLIPQRKLTELEAKLPKKLDFKKGFLYLVDPLGNIILLYALDAPPKSILKDLEKVLKVSQIG